MNEESASPPSALSLNDLITEHGRWLRTIALSRLRDAEAADEAVQNTVVATLDAMRRGVAVKRPAPWLYRVLLRQCLLHRRKLGRRRKAHERLARERQELCSIDRDLHDEAATCPLAGLLADERRQVVARVLRQLDERDAQLLLLKYVEAWSYRKIAEQLGVTEATVESRLHRARKKMRRQLARVGLKQQESSR